MEVTIVHSPLRSSWPPAADPEDSSCDENGNANASAGGWGAAPVAQIPDEDLRPRRHPCDTCNAASPDASCDDAATYLERIMGSVALLKSPAYEFRIRETSRDTTDSLHSV